MKNRRKK